MGASLALVAIVLSTLACGGDSPSSDSAFNYVLAYETEIAVFDMAAMSEDTVPGSLADGYAEMSTFGVLGVQPEEMDTLVIAENSGAGSDFAVFEGDLSFDNIRNVLHKNPAEGRHIPRCGDLGRPRRRGGSGDL